MQRFLPLLIAAVVVLGGATWYLNRPEEAGDALEKEGDAAPVLERDAGALAPAEREDDAALAPGATGSAERDAAARTAAGVEAVEGTVELPAGAPAEDLGVWVVTTVEDLERAEAEREDPDALVRVPVVDGRFRAPLPAGEARVRLLLDSEWLYLPERVVVSADDAPVLRPELGGALELVARAPLGDDAPIEGVEVELVGSEGGSFFSADEADRVVRLDADGRALVRALDADLSWQLTSVPETWAAVVAFGIEVEPGATAEHDITYRLGGRVAGVVRDESGEPVEGAEVEWDGEGRFADFGADPDAVRTDGEGRYRLFGIRPGAGAVHATAGGYREARADELRVADGEELLGVDLTLPEGLAIAGVVVGEDGAPLEGARVRAKREGGVEARWDRRNDFPEDETDADGRFRVAGLVEGTYRVEAQHRPPGDGVRRRNEIEGIRAGATDLRVVLARPPGIFVSVEDASSEPVVDASVLASNVAPDAGFIGRDTDRPDEHVTMVGSENEQHPGRYFVDGPWPGRWFVSVEADGLAQEGGVLEVLVEQREEVVVRMVPTATLAGVVLSPDGAPVPRANVGLRDPSRDGNMPFAAQFIGRVASGGADDDGRFELTDVAPGAYELSAEADEEWVDSEPLGIEVGPGERRTDLVLTLRRGGFLEGVVHGDDGRPDSGRTVMVFSRTNGEQPDDRTTDAAGAFRFGPLAPGTYQVMARPDMAKVQRDLEGDEEPSPAAFMRHMEMTTATVVEGETTRVVLGAPPEAPVRVHGRVTRAGEPVTSGMVTVIREGGSILDGFAPADVGADGRYELELDGPGRAVATWSGRGVGPSSFELAVDVPARDEFRLDIELPGGAIAGRVVDTVGAPISGASLTLDARHGLGSVTGFTAGRTTMSDADGGFRFENLGAGAYDLRAGGPRRFGRGAGRAATLVEAIEVRADATTDGVRVQLSEGGAVEGRVVAPGGAPARGATLFARRADGRLLSSTGVVDTDANGRFRYDGLPVGEVLLEARADGASCAPVRVLVGDDRAAEIELLLERSTELVVRALDADGEPLRVRLSVADAAGREMAGMLAMSRMQRRLTEGFDSTVRRAGPLPPGEYRVVATDVDGRSESVQVRLDGEPSREVELRFDGD